MRWAIFILSLALPGSLAAATLNAKLKPRTVNLGNSATLTIRCEGGEPLKVTPTHTPRNLILTFVSRKTEAVTLQGKPAMATVFTYEVKPKLSGRLAVPEFKTVVNAKEVNSELLVLSVLGRDGNNRPGNIAKSPPAILKVTTPVTTIYAGEAFPISMELMAQGLRQSHLPVPQVLNEGIRFTRIRPNYQQHPMVPHGNGVYHVFRFQTGAVSMKAGPMNLAFEVEVNVRDYSEDIFGREAPAHLTSEPIKMNILPLPKANQPENFTGAVGSFQLEVSAKPTRVRTGEPVELTVRVFGRGALEDTPVPEPAAWDGFKAHPASSNIDYLDSRHLSARKHFKQMVVPQRPGISEVPPLQFSFFNPQTKQYVNVQSAAIPLRVTGPAPAPGGQGDPPNPGATPEVDDVTAKLRTIAEHPGTLAPPRAPLLGQAWFIAIPGAALLAFVFAFAFRLRGEYLDTHEDTARRLEVSRLTRKTMRLLKQPETQANAKEFFAGVQLILRAHIGMALRQPAEGITAQAIEDAELALSDHAHEALNRLASQDDLTRFANDDGPIDPKATLRDLDTVIRELK